MSADPIQRAPGRRRRVPAAPSRATSVAPSGVAWSRTATIDIPIDVRAVPLRRGGALAWGDDSTTRLFQWRDDHASWQRGPDLPGPAHGAPGVRLADGSVLIVGAQDGAQVWRWAPGLPAFVPLRPLQVPRHGPAVVPSGAHGALVIGGFGLDGVAVGAIEVITPQGSFTRGQLLRPRPEPLAVVVPGEVVILGPNAKGDPVELPEVWPLGMGDGRLGRAAPEPRWGAAAIAYGETVLRVGGQGVPSGRDRGFLSQAHIYDPATDLWRSAGRLSSPRSRHRLVPWGRRQCLIIGGESDHPKVVARVECFDGSGWTRMSTLAVGRIEHDAIALSDGRVLVIGGRTLGDVPPPYSELSSQP
ncbi:MAG: kelch repeat-containing protein [Myxococcota bacterium]